MSTVNFKNPDICLICHDTFHQNEIVDRIHGIHDFHDTCLRSYVGKYGPASYNCPAGCRIPLSKATVIFWTRTTNGTYQQVRRAPLLKSPQARYEAQFIKSMIISGMLLISAVCLKALMNETP